MRSDQFLPIFECIINLFDPFTIWSSGNLIFKNIYSRIELWYLRKFQAAIYYYFNYFLVSLLDFWIINHIECIWLSCIYQIFYDLDILNQFL